MLRHAAPTGNRWSSPLFRVLLMLLVVSFAATALSLPGQTAAAAGDGGDRRTVVEDRRPNIVLITTDDQTLADLHHMPRTRRLIGGQGVTFDGMSPHPLCCPARAEILTGQYAQNNGVRSNSGRYGGYQRLRTRHTIATWLNRAGYQTVFLGKFLNGYSKKTVKDPAPGWDDWNPTVAGIYDYDHFTVSHNGRMRRHHAYQTDYFTEMAVNKIRQLTRPPKTAGAPRPTSSTKGTGSRTTRTTTRLRRPRPTPGTSTKDGTPEQQPAPPRQPFFLWQSYVAPHEACPPRYETQMCWAPPPPARRHRHMFPNAIPPSVRDEAFNERDIDDKPTLLQERPRFDRQGRQAILRQHRDRLRSLQAVDEGIAKMVQALAEAGELRNTLIIFASDNGYLLGEHRFAGKVMPYEQSVRIPLLMRGPGLPRGVRRSRVGTLIDIAPTILAVAKAKPTLTMDGRNLLPVAQRNVRSWDTLLLQAGPYYGMGDAEGWFYRGVRTSRYTYAHYLGSDEHELYDRQRDPFQLTNVADDPRYAAVRRELERRTRILGRCAGWYCRREFGPVPAPKKGPAPTVPDPTTPDPTVPDPTTPDPTTPDPTTPGTTEPDTTVPDPTTPDPTAPDTTTPGTTDPEQNTPGTSGPDAGDGSTSDGSTTEDPTPGAGEPTGEILLPTEGASSP